MAQVAILLLAAGAASRMRGGDKLTEVVEGAPLLRRQALRALSLGGPVFATLPPNKPARRAALDGLAVSIVDVPDAATGMSASIRAGVAALPAHMQAVVILPADMPEITAQDLSRVIDAFDGEDHIVQATSASGTPGHPVLFPARLFEDLVALSGDQGARAILRAEQVQRVALPDDHALTDLDTPEEWAKWRAAQLPLQPPR